jgi:hypothetical protein
VHAERKSAQKTDNKAKMLEQVKALLCQMRQKRKWGNGESEEIVGTPECALDRANSYSRDTTGYKEEVVWE